MKKYNNEIADKLFKWSSSCTFHCLPKVFSYKNSLIKFIWAFIFLTFVCLTFWLIMRCLKDYFEYEVVTKIRSINEIEPIFPAITICETNMFTSKEAGEMLGEFKQEIRVNNYTDAIKSTQLVTDFGFNKLILMNDSKKHDMGYSIDKVLQYCSFNGNLCSETDFSWHFSFSRGNCYQFNLDKNGTVPLKTVKNVGRNNGLLLILGPFPIIKKPATYFAHGLKISIHNSSFLSPSTEVIYVEKGKYTNIAISKTLHNRYSSPFSDCQDLSEFKSDLYDHIKNMKQEYRQKDCFDLCLQKIINDDCNCFYIRYPIFSNVVPCNGSNKCLGKHLSTMKIKIETECTFKCPLECDYTTYEWSLSNIDFPSYEFFDMLKQGNYQEIVNMSFDEYKQTHLALNIYLTSTQYTEISEIPKISLIDLVSNIGGALGIFLGFSIFSFIEVFEILFQILFIKLNREISNEK